MDINGYTMLVLKLANQIKRTFNMTTDYSGAQIRILYFLLATYEIREIYQKDIEHEFNIRSSTISSILKRMEKQKLIIRERVSCDDRLKKIVPAPFAIAKKTQIVQAVKGMESHIKEGISKKELALFVSVSQRMLANMEDELEVDEI